MFLFLLSDNVFILSRAALAGREGGFRKNFLGPMLRDPPCLFPTHAGGTNPGLIRVMLAYNRHQSRHQSK